MPLSPLLSFSRPRFLLLPLGPAILLREPKRNDAHRIIASYRGSSPRSPGHVGQEKGVESRSPKTKKRRGASRVPVHSGIGLQGSSSLTSSLLSHYSSVSFSPTRNPHTIAWLFRLSRTLATFTESPNLSGLFSFSRNYIARAGARFLNAPNAFFVQLKREREREREKEIELQPLCTLSVRVRKTWASRKKNDRDAKREFGGGNGKRSFPSTLAHTPSTQQCNTQRDPERRDPAHRGRKAKNLRTRIMRFECVDANGTNRSIVLGSGIQIM